MHCLDASHYGVHNSTWKAHLIVALQVTGVLTNATIIMIDIGYLDENIVIKEGRIHFKYYTQDKYLLSSNSPLLILISELVSAPVNYKHT